MAEDRLAWYESGRGDAAAAVARWHRIGQDRDNSRDLATVQPFLLPEASVTNDERVPITPADLPSSGAADPDVPQEILLEMADQQERKWCEEPVPALDGRTPTEAAADPTRRDELERLIASFPEIDPASGTIALRPGRLRELFGPTAR